MLMKREVGIGILGLGHVGKGTLDIIHKNRVFIEKEITPCKIKLTGLADLDVNRKPELEQYHSIFTNSAQKVIEHPETQIIVEAIGSEYPAYHLIKKALEMGKHVVTPNKEVVAKHGYELLTIARKNQVQFLFETSVGSAIPILGVITNMLTSCPLDEISGILNSTTNYILDLMFEKNMTQQEALKKAQEMGYAEADPSKDILGMDALYKIFILSSLGFRTRLKLDQINYSGINKISDEDIRLAKQLGYRIKLLATARKKQDYLDIRVLPVLIDQNHSLAQVQGVNNGIFLNGESYGELFFSGAGAGGIAGGSMIVSDIVRIIRQPQYFEYDYLVQSSEEFKIHSSDLQENNYFLRIQQEKQCDIRGRIEEILANKEILIEDTSIMTDNGNSLIIGLLTKRLQEETVRKGLKEIGQQISWAKVENCIKVHQSIK